MSGEGTEERLFTREEVLGGLPTKRARTVVFLIERHAAISAQKARASAAFVAPLETAVPMEATIWTTLLAEAEDPEDAALDPEARYVKAFGDRKARQKATFRDIERASWDWAQHVPANARLRAAVAHHLAEKYHFTRDGAAGVRQALGLDTEPVQKAYQSLYKQPLETIYAPKVGFMEGLKAGLKGLFGGK